MADSWLDLGSESTKFLIRPDWSRSPRRDFLYGRTLVGYPGTAQALYGQLTDLALTVEYEFANMSRAEEYELLTFFNTAKGRWKRFWLPIWQSCFTLNTTIAAGAATCLVNNTLFDTVYRGYERLFIELANGDLISRQITGVDTVSHTVERLTVASIFDREITAENIAYFGRLILCRLDLDNISLNYASAETSTLTLKFMELPKEYALL